METIERRLERFFAEYEARFNRTLGANPEIFGYITGDESKVLKEHGLIPGQVSETASSTG